MAKPAKKADKKDAQKEQELQFRHVARALGERGITVRREDLVRGPAFRVKSGSCVLLGQGLVFVDKRLPLPQQLTILNDITQELGRDELAAA